MVSITNLLWTVFSIDAYQNWFHIFLAQDLKRCDGINQNGGLDMKKLSLMLGVLFMVLTSKAHVNHGKSDLKLNTWNNSSFKVILDNQKFTKTNNFHLNNLTPGYHLLKVIRTKRNRYGNGGFRQVLFSGTIKIPKHSKVIATITPHRKLKVHVVKKARHHSHGKNGKFKSKRGHHGSFNRPTRGHYGSSHYNGGGFSNNGGYASNQRMMNEANFNRLLSMMKNESFDDDRLGIAKQAINNNLLTSEQVLQITSHFTFDDSKLDFAKLAYANTVDKESYFIINNEFTFSSTKNSLNQYINNYI